MSVEPRRGCGYRKVGGLYMVGGGVGIPCDRLPFELTVCTCCGQGIKQARGWTWIDVAKFFQGKHTILAGDPNIQTAPAVELCGCAGGFCPLCNNPESMGRAGLLWIGEKFYKTPDLFVKEGVDLGFSRRIKAVPQGFKVGETWVLLAHSKSVTKRGNFNSGFGTKDPDTYAPGIFYVWLPQRLEKIVLESTRGTEEIDALEKRGITPVFVPDDDKDHQGNVHDDLAAEKKEEADDNTNPEDVGF
jgi:hypothetical protein